MPSNISTLTPGTSPIKTGTTWEALGGDSGDCWDEGCGNTGWIQSTYYFGTAGLYKIRFGTTIVNDTSFRSGLALRGLSVAGAPVGAVPEPSTWMFLLMGFGLVGASLRRKRQTAQPSFA